MSTRVNQSTLARTLGVSRQAIHDLVRRNVLVPDENGTFNLEEARAIITDRVRPSGKAATAAASVADPISSTPLAPPATTATAQVQTANETAQPPQQDQQLSYHVAKTLREAAEARMAQLKLQEMQRKLIQAEPTLSAIYSAFRPLRDQCMLVGRRVAPTVASTTDRREVKLLIDRAMAEILDVYVKTTLPKLVAAINGAPRDLPHDVSAAAQAPADEGAAP